MRTSYQYRIAKALLLKRFLNWGIWLFITSVIFFYDIAYNDGVGNSFCYLMMIPLILDFTLFLNFYLEDKGKTVEIDLTRSEIRQAINGRVKVIPISDVKGIVHCRGRKDDSGIYSLPFMHYKYYKIYTHKETIILTCLSIDKLDVFKEITQEKVSLLNFIDDVNPYIKQVQKKKIK